MEETNPFLVAQPEVEEEQNPFLVETPVDSSSSTPLPPEQEPDRDPLLVSDAGTEAANQGPVENKFGILDRAHAAGLMGWQGYDLPTPDYTMYDDVRGYGRESMDQAMARYNMYREHPNSETNVIGQVFYNGKLVPLPEQPTLPNGSWSPGMGQMLEGGLRNTVNNVGEVVGAVTDAGRDYMQNNVGQMFLFDREGNFSPDWKNPEEISALSEEEFQNASIFGGRTPMTEMGGNLVGGAVPGDSIANTLLMEGTSMMVPGIMATKLIGWGGRLGTLARVGAFELGAASGASTDGGSLLIGENALFKGVQDVFPLLRGIEAPPDSPEYQRTLANRANILMDAMAVGKGVEMGVQGISWGVRFSWSITGAPISNAVRPSAREDAIAREILDTLTGVTDDAASTEAARTRIIRLVEENKDVFTEMPEGLADSIRYTADTMTALERALDGNDVEGARRIIIRAQELRKGVMSGGGADTTVAASQPAIALENATKQAETNLGGTQAINQSNDALVASGTADVAAADARVAGVEARIVELDNTLNTLIREDAGLISKVGDLERTVGFDITTGANQAADNLRTNITRASEVMDAEKNRLFAAVEGGQIDVDAMISTLRGLRPEQLDLAASALPGDNMLGTLLDQVRLRTKEVDGQMVRETEEEMRTRVAQWATDNGLDYAKLFTDVRVSLSDSIGRMTRQGASAAENAAAQTLIRFKTWIDDDAIEFLQQNGDEATVEAAQNALTYFKETWAVYWDDGSVLSDVGRLRRETTARGKQEPMFLDTSRNMITDTIGNRNREVVGNMIDLLRRPEGGANPTLVVDYIIGDTLSTLSSKLDNPSMLREINIDDVRKSLQGYASIIRENFPDEAQRLDDLLGRLRDARAGREVLDAELTAAQDAATAARDQIYENELRTFFQREGVPNIEGYRSFSTLFGDVNAARVNPDGSVEGPLADLVSRAERSGNPMVIDGIQAAYARYVRENFMTATREAGGNRMVSIGMLNRSENEISKILEYGDIVYGNKPGFMEGIRELVAEAGLAQRGRNAKAIGVGSGTAEANAAIAAVNRTVTMTLGVLSRLGARVRSTASGVIMRNVDPRMSMQIMDQMLSDPDYFIEIASRVTRADGAVDPQGAEMLRKWLIRSGIYSEDNEPNEESFLLGIADAELSYRQARETFDQTTRALTSPR